MADVDTLELEWEEDGDPVVEAAIHAFEQGWSPIPIRKGEKRPAHSEWQNTRYKTKNEIESAFADSNLGVLLGDASNGLIDIDLDAPEAQVLADGFLPVTRMMHGRESSPKSHYWYRVEGWTLRVVPFYDPVERDKQNKGQKYNKDRLVLIEIRGTGGQTLLPPSTHPNGEQYRWNGGKWHKPAVVPHDELERQTRWLAAAALLARHWPGEGMRHQASMALAGGLLKLGDENLATDAEAFVASVALAAGDEEGFERQQDVATTRKLIDKGKKVKGWPSLAKLIDKRVVKQVIEWLSPPPEDVLDYSDGHMTRQLLAEYMAGNVQPHPMLVPDLIYSSKVTWLQGEPGNGKTIFALWLVKQCVENGYRVMMIDEESGPRMTGERLIGLGAEPQLVEEQFFYYPFSSINVLDSDHRQNFNSALAEAKPHLIIFDSVADILSQAGLKENENDDINSLIKHFVDPLRSQDVATLFIDHMSKAQSDNGWARGAGSKKSKTDAAWTFTARKAFDKQTIGRVSLKRSKDRLGQLPLTHVFKMGGDGAGKIILESAEVMKEIKVPKDEPANEIIDYLKVYADTEDSAQTQADIASYLKRQPKEIYVAFEWIKKHMDKTPLESVEREGKVYWFYAGDVDIDWAMVGD